MTHSFRKIILILIIFCYISRLMFMVNDATNVKKELLDLIRLILMVVYHVSALVEVTPVQLLV